MIPIYEYLFDACENGITILDHQAFVEEIIIDEPHIGPINAKIADLNHGKASIKISVYEGESSTLPMLYNLSLAFNNKEIVGYGLTAEMIIHNLETSEFMGFDTITTFVN